MQKIIMVGLDAAGKTCLLEKAFNLKDPNLLTEILPTQGVDRQPYEFIGADMIIWDMGGQIQYRDRYFDRPEMLQGATAVIFVVDVQDPDRFVEAASYWARILKVLKDEKVRKYIFYHKFDPEKVEMLKENLIRARQIIGILNAFLEKPALSFATSIYADTADRAARQVLWDILPPIEVEGMSTVSNDITAKETEALREVLPQLEEDASIQSEVTSNVVNKVSDRLAYVVEEQLHSHDDLIALGIFKQDGAYVSGVAKNTTDRTLLDIASNALKNVGKSFVDEIKANNQIGPVQLDFGEFTVYFEIVSPDDVSAIFCTSSPTTSMIQTISKINKSLNQAIGFIPTEIESPIETKQTLMSELKSKLQKKRQFMDFQSRYGG